MTGTESLLGMALGVGLGARHALEPDHLAAVSVLAAEDPSARRGMLIGALWGAGHTLSLLGCGLIVAVAATELPARLTDGFELAVAAMLVLLGGRAVLRAAREGGRGPSAVHRHRHGALHIHAGAPGHVHVARRVLAIRPLIAGALHGLAGSGALTALVMTRLSDVAARVAFMSLFGLGSVAAMCAISGLAGWPLSRVASRPSASRFLFAAAGVTSFAVGVVWALPVV